MFGKYALELKRLDPTARFPQLFKAHEVGYTLFSTQKVFIRAMRCKPIPTGFSLEVKSPRIYATVEPRPFLLKRGLVLYSRFIINPNEETVLTPIIFNGGDTDVTITPGVAIAWLMIFKSLVSKMELVEK